MIKDSQQSETTQYWVQRFTEAENKMLENQERKLKDPDGWLLIKDSYVVQRQKLLNEITEYETLMAHNPLEPVNLFVEDMNKLSDLLIKARIAFKVTQKELAYLCDLTEDKVKIYEEKDYEHASYLDFQVVSDALGIRIINGNFVVQMHNFYLKKLNNVRKFENVNVDMQAAS